jgi:hypothetical protein
MTRKFNGTLNNTITGNLGLTSQLNTTQQFTELFAMEEYNSDLSKTSIFSPNNYNIHAKIN